jgi:hypothetical protein
MHHLEVDNLNENGADKYANRHHFFPPPNAKPRINAKMPTPKIAPSGEIPVPEVWILLIASIILPRIIFGGSYLEKEVHSGNGKPHIYELTAFGKKVLTTSERGVKEPLLMESYDVKFRLLTDLKRDVIAWEKLGDPQNWQKWGFKYCGIRIERNDGLFPTIIILTGEISGFSPYEIVAEAGMLIALVKAKLHDLGVILDDVGIPLHELTFHTYTQEAEILNREGTVYTDCGHIDHSPPEKVPHEERNFAQQVNYMGLPNLVKQLEKKIDSQNTDLNHLRKENTEIKDSMATYVSATTKFVSEVTLKQEETTKQFTSAMQQFTNYLQEVSTPKGQTPKRLYE